MPKRWCTGCPKRAPVAESGLEEPELGSHVERRVVVLRADRAHVREPVSLEELRRSLEPVSQHPGLALVRPVVGLQTAGGAEVRGGLRLTPTSPEVLRQLEVTGSQASIVFTCARPPHDLVCA